MQNCQMQSFFAISKRNWMLSIFTLKMKQRIVIYSFLTTTKIVLFLLVIGNICTIITTALPSFRHHKIGTIYHHHIKTLANTTEKRVAMESAKINKNIYHV